MTQDTPQPDLQIDPRDALLDAVLVDAGYDGWTPTVLRRAVATAGLPDGAEELYFPGGATEMIAYWGERCDAHAAQALADMDLAALRIRERVTAGVWARLSAMSGHEDAARRALARLALPDALGLAPKILWAASDTVWRAIGDTSTDANFYTKRMTLSAVISAAMAAWINDADPEKAKARAALDARIENVMQFEKFKAKAKKASAAFPNPVEILSDIRFGRRSRYRRRG